MSDDREKIIRDRIKAATTVLWAYERRAGLLTLAAQDHGAAVDAIAAGASVSTETAREVLDSDTRLAAWTEQDIAALRRSVAELEEWLADGQELHPAVRRAVAPILADIERTRGVRMVVEPRTVAPDANLIVVVGGNGIRIDPWDEDIHNICEVAGVLQTAIVEESWQIWPECPLHTGGHHPLAPSDEGWCCPETSAHVADFGRLG